MQGGHPFGLLSPGTSGMMMAGNLEAQSESVCMAWPESREIRAVFQPWHV